MKKTIVLACFAWVVTDPAGLPAQKDKEKPTPGDEMIYKYLCAETDKLSKKVLDGAKTLEEWQKKRPRLHQEYMDMLGLSPLPKKTELKPTVTRSFTHEGVAIENLHFQSMPGLYVTANFYRPKTVDKPLPTILYACGHGTVKIDGVSYGIRTRVAALKERSPRPLDDGDGAACATAGSV